MSTHVALRRTISKKKNLPRPKLVQELLLVGTQWECQALIDELALKPEHQSTDEVEVEFRVRINEGQKSFNSRDRLPHGKNSYARRQGDLNR